MTAVLPATELLTRDAQLTDAPAICGLLESWAARGLTLARTVEEIEGMIERFTVVEHGGRVIACAAVDPIEPGMGEVRSVAVCGTVTGLGAGRAVMNGLVARASANGCRRLVLLSKTPSFFERVGFEVIEPDDAPESYIVGHLAGQGRTHLGRAVMSRSLAL